MDYNVPSRIQGMSRGDYLVLLVVPDLLIWSTIRIIMGITTITIIEIPELLHLGLLSMSIIPLRTLIIPREVLPLFNNKLPLDLVVAMGMGLDIVKLDWDYSRMMGWIQRRGL